MKVLIISTNFLPMIPSGAAYIAGAALKAGHSVEVFECLFAKNLIKDLEKKIKIFKPEVIGISIMLVTGDIDDKSSKYYTKYFDLRPKIKEIITCIKQISDAEIILGGPGFNYYGKDWLEYLDLDYGLRGECENSFPLYLSELEKKGNIYEIPGSIFIRNGEFHKVPRELIEDFDNTGFPAYELFDLDNFKKFRIPCAIFTKRGCAFNCTFCPHSSLEGKKYRLKSANRVVDEIEYVLKTDKVDTINFCDNSFNVPKKHAEDICKEIIHRKLDIKWTSGAIKPIGITTEFIKLLKESGCSYITLAIETASEKMLKNMNRGYKLSQIENALDLFGKSSVTFGISVLIGAPGETPDTIADTFRVIEKYPKINDLWVSVGLCLWSNHQKIVDEARSSGQLRDDKELFSGAYYISPELKKEFMKEFIESLASKKKCGFQVNIPYVGYQSKR